MGRLEFTEEAAADLRGIWDYISEQNPSAAARLVAVLDEHCMFLADNPMVGQAKPELRLGLRYFPVKNYLILYRLIEGGVEIVRVIHGNRNLTALFGLEE